MKARANSAPSLSKKPDARREFARADAAAKFIRAHAKLRPQIAVVLGSGLGAFADELDSATRIPYARIPHFPRSTAVGHAGQLVIGKTSGVPVAAMQGRIHLYEGYSPAEVVFPIRALARFGIRTVILTNAAGGINTNYDQGALVIIRDHINLLGKNPLTGANDERFGPRFPDMSEAYSASLRAIALEEARRLGITPHEGIYAAVPGPSYETPAEIRYLRTIGADLVGMSTVPEVIAARHMHLRVLGISCVTNMAAGILNKPLDHAEVLETGRRVSGQFIALLRAVIPRIAAGLNA
ncbi:MAG TPA: purine-nucleoside phosphorylase [Candidatus Acidoferrales bacterium]|nr:purine-nucleoside phosphorylase [Candidatus Acidoferrales bacterium]